MNDIPYQLPPNAVHIDLSNNGFSGNVPYSISQMTDLEYLNLGHNHLNGQLSDMFQKLPKLKMLDLSYNSLSGNLPSSFGALSSLNVLYLQNNQFTGMINVLAGLPLDELNLEDNRFTGWIPDELKNINSIEAGGNSWSSGPSPPPPPGARSVSAKDNRKMHDENKGGGGKRALNAVALTLVVLAALLIVALLITLFSRRTSSPSSHFLDEEMASHHRAFTPLTSQELSSGVREPMHKQQQQQQRERSLFHSSSTIDMKTLQKSPSVGFKCQPPCDFVQSLTDNEFARRLSGRRSSSARSMPFSLAELQAATGNFASGRLLGEGSLGRVYRAKFSDGKDLVVKKIDSSLFQGLRPEEYSEIVSTISRVRHPNVSELVGYCSEQGHNMLIYELCRNGSLHEFLHLSDDYSKPLTWNTRIRIALGTARAIEYLHEVCSPSFIHKNIKSSNILLDLELNPRLSDYGLAVFHQRTSQNLGTGYSAPECSSPSGYTLKSDIYSFGVVMLELLTGRMPLDKSRAKSEQCLVRWASPQLHDAEALTKMVDPALRGLYPPKSLSRFADIIALCVQEEQEFRPAMSEVVQALVRLVQRSSMNMRDDLAASRRTDDSDYYY